MQRSEAPPDSGKLANTPGKDEAIATKREYNRWLVTQENWQSAEDVRAQRKDAADRLEERERKHKTQGLSRQQAATAQMKKASEAVEEHREENLTLGRQVAEEITIWKKGAEAQQQAYIAYGAGVREAVKAADATAQSMAALSVKKKTQASTTRKEDEETAKAVERLKEEKQRLANEQAARVRSETADQVTDAAKRHFYEQRLKSAKETKVDQERWQKERTEEKLTFDKQQQVRRKKSKAAREQAGKSVSDLLIKRQQDGVALREQRRSLAEEKAKRKKEEEEKKVASVKSVHASIAFDPGVLTGGATPVRGPVTVAP
uniref:Uncharacterized protein n=1 Tax=Haptolina brevifila TaxID=156173 RepID=A0A7S2H432_9EUKA|mmetsp:Transcript_51038/g.101548  ORF Transcript_51038/g.101548 Transcript_51038/m.101548 type:complete len:318 (+) Transcript_51038:107-1060(+)